MARRGSGRWSAKGEQSLVPSDPSQTLSLSGRRRLSWAGKVSSSLVRAVEALDLANSFPASVRRQHKLILIDDILQESSRIHAIAEERWEALPSSRRALAEQVLHLIESRNYAADRGRIPGLVLGLLAPPTSDGPGDGDHPPVERGVPDTRARDPDASEVLFPTDAPAIPCLGFAAIASIPYVEGPVEDAPAPGRPGPVRPSVPSPRESDHWRQASGDDDRPVRRGPSPVPDATAARAVPEASAASGPGPELRREAHDHPGHIEGGRELRVRGLPALDRPAVLPGSEAPGGGKGLPRVAGPSQVGQPSGAVADRGGRGKDVPPGGLGLDRAGAGTPEPMTIDLSEFGEEPISFPGAGQVPERGFVSADVPDARSWHELVNVLPMTGIGSVSVDLDAGAEDGWALAPPTLAWVERGLGAINLTLEQVRTVRTRPSTSKGFHLELELEVPIYLADAMTLREALGDDPRRMLADAMRAAYCGLPEAAAGLLWDAKCRELTPEEKGGKKGSARVWTQAREWTTLYPAPRGNRGKPKTQRQRGNGKKRSSRAKRGN